MGAVSERLRKHLAAMAALLICLIHFFSFDIANQPLVTDVRYFVYFAWRVAEGAVPHLTYFENKTQLATFAGALFYRLGEVAGVSPLSTIRAGYLTLAALGGLGVFHVFRRLGRGSVVVGFLGVLAYCSFGLLGILPATGNVPKLLMAICATFAALAAQNRRWLLGGALGALAFMDWQMGLLVWLGVAVAAAVHGEPRRAALTRVSAGGLVGLGPFLVYYLTHDALVETVRQVIGATFARGAATLEQEGPGERLARIGELVRIGCPQQQGLFYLGLAGIAVVCWWLWREGRGESGRILIPLAVYHLGILAFGLVDFQYYGDLFALLHSMAFFLGVVWLAMFRVVSGSVERPRTLRIAGTVGILIAVALARPAFLRPHLELRTPIAEAGTSLLDQQTVASSLLQYVGEGKPAMLAGSELLFLMRRENALPLVYWNRAAWSRFRLSPDESFADAGLRISRSVEADVFVVPAWLGYDDLLQRGYSVVTLVSPNDGYSVTVAVRSAGAPACLRPPSEPPHDAATEPFVSCSSSV